MVMTHMLYLNSNFYEDKSGNHRCYAQFVNIYTGEVTSFDARTWRSESEAPELFQVCDVACDMRQYGRSVTFILTAFKVVGNAVMELGDDKKGGSGNA